ncbi:hypothetical protein [Streptomyces sp. NPDC088757]|uniref:hypothetical protein n=1 Tax=Streptomyces sp. NPDC088757 TaxID=3365889 RepID=UPI00381A1991
MTPAPSPDPDPAPSPSPSPSLSPSPSPSPSPPSDQEHVRDLLARAVRDVVPGPVPLAAVRRAGLARRRRRAAGLSALSVLGAAAAVAAVVVLTPVRPSPAGPAHAAAQPSTARTPSPPPSRTPPPTPPRAPDPSPVRVVAPGERVDAGQGYTVWLTEEGKHWNGPEEYENFRSAVDGNVDTSEPGVSHQSEGGPAGAFHSGLYYGTRTAGRVELTAPGGRTVLATLLELPGRPGWGVWYAHTGPGVGETAVTLYDRAGKRLAGLPA